MLNVLDNKVSPNLQQISNRKMIITQRNLVKIEDEVWREVPDYHNRYQVSNYGRVKSFAFKKDEGQLLKNYAIKGFKTVHLQVKDKHKTYYLHKLIADIWIPRPSDEYNIVSHKDGNIKNNHISNLIWMTKEMLWEHHRELRLTKGFGKPKTQINNSKLKINDIKLLKTMLLRGTPQNQIAKMFCISEMQVSRIKQGENWGHVQVDRIQ
jgi:hypothetical protein